MSEAKECVGGWIVQMMHDPPIICTIRPPNPHDARAETHTLCQGRRPPAHGSHCYRPATISHTDGRRPQARLRMMHARSASDFGAGPASCGARGFLYTPAIVFSVVFLCFCVAIEPAD